MARLTITSLQQLAQSYLEQPSIEKRWVLERAMSDYAKVCGADLKQLMQLRLHLYQESKRLEEALQF